jgi:urea transport system permease protein
MTHKNGFTQTLLGKQSIGALFLLALWVLPLAGIAADQADQSGGVESGVKTLTAPDAVTQQMPPGEPSIQTFASLVQSLKESSFAKKLTTIESIAKTDQPQTLPLLKALSHNSVYRRKTDDKVVIATKVNDSYQLIDAASGEALGTAAKSELKKIIVNNQMRSSLRESIARLSLSSPMATVRLQAVKEMLGDMDEKTVNIMREMAGQETNDQVKEMLNVAIAISDLNSSDKTVRMNAIHTLSGSIEPEAKNALMPLVSKGPDNQYTEPDADVRTAAKSALNNIQSSLDFYHLIETTFFGLSLGSVLLLAAIGLAITFGVMGVINMAHGELIMLGAYTTYVIQQLMPNYIGVSVIVAIPAAFIVAGLAGIAIERGVIRFLYGRPLETLLATFGISLILQQLVRSVFSPLNRTVETPSWMSGTLEINSALSLTYNRLYIVLFSLIVFFALLLVLKKTVLGLQVRAVSQNRAMARAMGVRSEWVDALTFGLGSGIAGVAGVALSQLTNVGPNMGQSYIIDSFMVVVFGGVGNLWGTFVGAVSLGIFNKYLEPYSGAVMAKILVLVFIILFIQKRPRGLFPQKGRAAEN